PQPSILNPQPSTLNSQPSTLNPQPSTLNPQPSTLNPQPSTLNPQPQARRQPARLFLSSTPGLSQCSIPSYLLSRMAYRSPAPYDIYPSLETREVNLFCAW
ncbi:hypothetical protein T484DRAFT_1619744, partial [Baffinella frigidus]